MINKDELMNRILLLEPDLTQALLELISDYETKMEILEILTKSFINKQKMENLLMTAWQYGRITREELEKGLEWLNNDK